MQETQLCPSCGASMKQYWHRLTPGLVGVLIKCYDFVKENGHNHFKKKDLKLSHSEYGNFQKLRFHALLAKYKVDGKWTSGEWLLTHRGAEFLCGKVEVPIRVQTFRNRVVDHDPVLTHISRVWQGEMPWFESKFDYSLFQPKQESLI